MSFTTVVYIGYVTIQADLKIFLNCLAYIFFEGFEFTSYRIDMRHDTTIMRIFRLRPDSPKVFGRLNVYGRPCY